MKDLTLRQIKLLLSEGLLATRFAHPEQWHGGKAQILEDLNTCCYPDKYPEFTNYNLMLITGSLYYVMGKYGVDAYNHIQYVAGDVGTQELHTVCVESYDILEKAFNEEADVLVLVDDLEESVVYH